MMLKDRDALHLPNMESVAGDSLSGSALADIYVYKSRPDACGHRNSLVIGILHRISMALITPTRSSSNLPPQVLCFYNGYSSKASVDHSDNGL